MQKRKLGNTQFELPIIGLGCMGLSEFYGPPTEQAAAIKLLHEAIELAVRQKDTLPTTRREWCAFYNKGRIEIDMPDDIDRVKYFLER